MCKGRSVHFCLSCQVRLQPRRHHERLVDVCQNGKVGKGLPRRRSRINKGMTTRNKLTGLGVSYKAHRGQKDWLVPDARETLERASVCEWTRLPLLSRRGPSSHSCPPLANMLRRLAFLALKAHRSASELEAWTLLLDLRRTCSSLAYPCYKCQVLQRERPWLNGFKFYILPGGHLCSGGMSLTELQSVVFF